MLLSRDVATIAAAAVSSSDSATPVTSSAIRTARSAAQPSSSPPSAATYGTDVRLLFACRGWSAKQGNSQSALRAEWRRSCDHSQRSGPRSSDANRNGRFHQESVDRFELAVCNARLALDARERHALEPCHDKWRSRQRLRCVGNREQREQRRGFEWLVCGARRAQAHCWTDGGRRHRFDHRRWVRCSNQHGCHMRLLCKRRDQRQLPWLLQVQLGRMDQEIVHTHAQRPLRGRGASSS